MNYGHPGLDKNRCSFSVYNVVWAAFRTREIRALQMLNMMRQWVDRDGSRIRLGVVIKISLQVNVEVNLTSKMSIGSDWSAFELNRNQSRMNATRILRLSGNKTMIRRTRKSRLFTQ